MARGHASTEGKLFFSTEAPERSFDANGSSVPLGRVPCCVVRENVFFLASVCEFLRSSNSTQGKLCNDMVSSDEGTEREDSVCPS